MQNLFNDLQKDCHIIKLYKTNYRIYNGSVYYMSTTCADDNDMHVSYKMSVGDLSCSSTAKG